MRLALSIFAENLPKVSNGGPLLGLGEVLPNPFAIVTVLYKENETCTPIVLGQTEYLHSTISPLWTKKLTINSFSLGQPMHIVVALYDKRRTGENVPIGSVLFEVGAIVGSMNSVLAKEMKKDSNCIVGVRIEEKPIKSAGTFQLHLRGYNLKNKDGFGLGLAKSDPFYEIHRLRYSSKRPNVAAWEPIYTSSVKANDLNPIWPETYIDMEDLGNNRNEKLRMVVLDYDEGSFSDKIGEVQFTVNQLIGRVNQTAASTDPKRIDSRKSFLLKKKQKERGLILVIAAAITGVEIGDEESETVPSIAGLSITNPSNETSTIEEEGNIEVVEELSEEEMIPSVASTDGIAVSTGEVYSFIDFVSGGCELRVIIGIDVSGGPQQSNSDYEQALVAICNMLSRYDSDQKFPMYGFGGHISNGNGNCFRFGSTEKEADGVDGIINLYRETVQTTGLINSSSSRNFADLIEQAGADAKENMAKQQSYSILLLFTNGNPDDNDATINALRQVDDAPLSIVLIGVGNDAGAFAGLKELEEISQNNQCGRRDKVRMVHVSDELKADHDKLTAAALNQIPNQLEQYFKNNGIAPQVPTLPETDNFGDIAFETYDAQNDITVPMEFNPTTGSVTITQKVKAPRLMPKNVSSRRRGGILHEVGRFLTNDLKKNCKKRIRKLTAKYS